MLSETTVERIRNFRLDRLSKIISGDIPVSVNKSHKVVLHIIPINAFDPAFKVDVISLENNLSDIKPIFPGSMNFRFNFDGILTYSQSGSETYSYVQVFRNGIIEALNTSMLEIRDGRSLIPSVGFEKELIQALGRYLKVYRHWGVEPPIIVMLSLFGVKGYSILVSPGRFFVPDVYPIDRDDLVIPEVLIQNFSSNPSEILRPIFDSIWNASGWPRSMNYGEDGIWNGR